MSYLKNALKASAPGGAPRFFALMRSALVIWLSTRTLSVQAEIYFNPRFLSDDPAAVADLSGFEKGQEVPPGSYRVDIYLNDDFIATRDVTFGDDPGEQGLMPCFTPQQIIDMGIQPADSGAEQAQGADSCQAFTLAIQGATSRFDVGQQRLYLTVPQIFLGNHARGAIAPELWDSGITAGLLNYNFTGNSVQNSGSGKSHYAYLNLNSGFNMGAWRLRDNSTWMYNSGGGGAERINRWQHVNSWLERDIIPLRSRLTLGDSFTNGDIFDGINFRGVQLASDDNMLPDSLRGFAPTIRGIARGTARVSVRQNGYEIYQSTVPPGPFVINDLYAAGSGGDLQVTIKESDGSLQTFSVPWSTVPALQREGHTRFALTAGEYRSGGNQQDKPGFVQATALHGLPLGWTLFGGGQFADNYRTVNVGGGKNMGDFGAVSADVTHASATLPDSSRHEGQSLRFLYNKSVMATGTRVQLVGYRYSTRGYYSFADTTYRRMEGYSLNNSDGTSGELLETANLYNLNRSKRGKFQLSITQQLGQGATLYLSGSRQTYWSTNKVDEQLQAGLNGALQDINVSLNYSQSKSGWQSGRDHMLALNLNIPFSHWLRSDSASRWRGASASFSTSTDMEGRSTSMAGLYGTLLEDRNLSYSVQMGDARGGESGHRSTGYGSMNYRGAYGNANVGYSSSTGYKNLYYGLSGGIVAHGDGVTLSQPMNDTVVLVKAPGAKGAKVENQTGVRTDWRGYAVLPYAMEYRDNRVALDTNTLADNVDLENAVVNVVPTYGAVVRADFNARVGTRVLMTLTYRGKPVPFGAEASGEGGSSIVADGGQVYLSGMPLSGKVRVRWGDGADSGCVADYAVPDDERQSPIVQLTAQCS